MGEEQPACEALPLDQAPAIRVLAMPADTNAAGDIFGGWLMSQVDIAGSIVALQRARGRVVTVAVNEFLFLKPVFVGDLISLYAKVTRVGHTSITVKVQGFAQRSRRTHEVERVCEAALTYVAIDENRRPRPVRED